MMNCTKCNLSRKRVNVVAGRGDIQATILIIGEAPGKAEDVLGQAFIGESGKLLEDLLQKAGVNPKDCFYINAVFCRPCDEFTGENREPTKNEIFMCLENVTNVIATLKNLQQIIFVGKVAKRWYSARFKGIPQVNIIHPAVLLRQGGKASPHYRDALNHLIEFRRAYESV